MIWALFLIITTTNIHVPSGYVRVAEFSAQEQCEISRSQFINTGFKDELIFCSNVLPGYVASHILRK